MKQRFLKYVRHSDLNFTFIVSLIGILICILLVFTPTLSWHDRKLIFAGIGLMTVMSLHRTCLNFKRRCMFDPKLNMISISSIEEMRQYSGITFEVMDDIPIASLTLHYKGFGQQEPLFIHFYPSEIHFFEWSRRIRKLGDQRIAAITFYEEEKGGRMLYKFWTLNSKEEYIFSGEKIDYKAA